MTLKLKPTNICNSQFLNMQNILLLHLFAAEALNSGRWNHYGVLCRAVSEFLKMGY